MMFWILGAGFLGKAFETRLLRLGVPVKLFSFRHERERLLEEIGRRRARLGETIYVVNASGTLPGRAPSDEELWYTNALFPISLWYELSMAQSSFHLFQIGSSLEQDVQNQTDYVLAKRSATGALLEDHSKSCPVSVLQIGTIYGSFGEDHGFLSECIRTVGAGRTFMVKNATERRDFVFIDEVVDVLIQLAGETESKKKLLSVGTGRLVSRFEAAKTVAQVLERDESLVVTGEQTMTSALLIDELRPVDVRLAIDLRSGLERFLRRSLGGRRSVWVPDTESSPK